MEDYNYILNIFSLLLIIGILFIILYGCQYKKYYEGFTDIQEQEENEKNIQGLSAIETAVIKKLTNDEMSIEQFTDLIEKAQFTKENLNNIIDYVEKFESKNGLKT